MDPREQFWTEEFFRYSAECGRLARLAQKPHNIPEGSLARLYRHTAERLGDIRHHYIAAPAQRLQFARAGRPVRR
jgi:hypothetical protein